MKKKLTASIICLTLAAMIIAILLMMVGCSSDSVSPTSSVATADFPLTNQYPALTPEALAAGPAPGFRFLQLNTPTLDDGDDCDSASESRWCRDERNNNVSIHDLVSVSIRRGRLEDDTRITIVSPMTCYAVADFYPHPYQFNGEVEIIWEVREFDLPRDFDYSTLVPWYINDNGEYEPVNFEWRGNFEQLVVRTNHFSRYIVGQTGGGG